MSNPMYKTDNDRISNGEKPRYVVWSEKVGCPFVSAEVAISWHNDLLEQGVETRIFDLTNYDWDTNPLGFRFHSMNGEH